MSLKARYLTKVEVVVIISALLVMVVIIAIALLPNLREKARELQCAQNLKNIGFASLMYTGEFGGYFPNVNRHDLGSAPDHFGNWQPIDTAKIMLSPNMVWACPSAMFPSPAIELSNYRYIGSGLKDDNHHPQVVSLGYDASGNHPQNAWMNALFIDGHVDGARPDGSLPITYVIPDGPRTNAWNRNDW
jgi:prepilin-type processing-associated H-X9-DG protein